MIRESINYTVGINIMSDDKKLKKVQEIIRNLACFGTEPKWFIFINSEIILAAATLSIPEIEVRQE